MYIHVCIQLIPVPSWLSRNFNSGREDKQLARSFFHSTSCNYLKSPKPGALHHLSFFAEDNFFDQSKGAWFTMMEDPPSWSAAGFEFHSFQFFQKCPNIDLTLTSCLAEIENKFQLVHYCTTVAKTVTVTVTP